MPVRKFRSVEELNQPVWRQPGDAALYRAIAAVWEMGRRTQTRRFVPGVHRFHGIDELEQAADERRPAILVGDNRRPCGEIVTQ